MHGSQSTVSPQPLPELLLVDSEAVTSRYIAPLRERFRVSRMNAVATAVQYVARTSTAPSLGVVELELPDGSGTEICRAMKALPVPATVLVTTADVDRVPAAIEAGCDAVLLKPFAPNLLFGRLGRLLRARSAELRNRSLWQHAKAQHLRDRSDMLRAGTNHEWPNTHCPHCAHAGVISFEYTSYRRAWYACLSCRKVWLAKRQE